MKKIDKALLIAQQEVFKRYSSSAEDFIREMVHIESDYSETGITKFNLWDSQKDVLQKFLTERLLIILKARQLGLTWLTLAYAVWRMIFNVGYTVIAISKKEEPDAKLLVKRIDLILRYMPRWLIREKKGKTKYSCPTWERSTLSVTIHHPNGEASTFTSLSAAPDSGRSFTANLVILDEWAFQDYASEIWASAFPTINRPNGGQVIGLSTAKRGTFFEEMWDLAMEEKSILTPIFLPWWADPNRDQEWYEKTKAAMPVGTDKPQNYHTDYPETPEEAFMYSGDSVFDNEKILKRIKTLRKYYEENPPLVGNLECKYDSNGDPIKGTEKFVEDKNGWLTVYELPQPGKPYVIGGDIAEGGKDWSVGQVLDNTNGKLVATWRAHTDTDIYAKQMFMLGHFYNYALIAIEMNFDTHPVKELTRLKYRNQYRREVIDSISNKKQYKYGFQTTRRTRPLIVGDLVAVAREELGTINDITTLQEMTYFVRDDDGKPRAQEGKHDDTVMALAIAHRARLQQTSKPKHEEKLRFAKNVPISERERIKNNILFEQKYREMQRHLVR